MSSINQNFSKTGLDVTYEAIGPDPHDTFAQLKLPVDHREFKKTGLSADRM